MTYDAYVATFALLCFGGALVVLILGIRAALHRRPRNRYRDVLPPPSERCLRVPDESTAYRIR